MLSREMRVTPPARARRRALAASTLRALALALARLAKRLSRPAPAAAEPMYEFHAEAGAPEGALYVNGKLVGTLPGVTRL